MNKAKTSFLLNLMVVLSIVMATFSVSALAIEAASAPQATRPQAWETLSAEIKTKIDPRILAELWGEVIPAHLAAALGRRPSLPLRANPWIRPVSWSTSRPKPT